MAELAAHGSVLYRNLFTDAAVKDAMRDLKAKGASRPDRPLKIQIIEGQNKVYIPWQILYDDENYKSYEKEKFTKDGFWGYKYIVDYRPDGPGQSYDTEILIDNCRRFNLMFGSYKGSPRLRAPLNTQRRFFNDAKPYLSWTEYSEKLKFLRALEGRERSAVHMLYFYTHATNGRDVSGDEQAYIPIPENAAIFFSALEGMKPRDLFDLKRAIGAEIPLRALPIVFINACESVAVNTYDYDKFIEAFSDLGIRGLLGTEAEVDIETAKDFALKFFDQLFKRKKIGDILYSLRRDFLNRQNNPIGFFYSYFGNPSVHLKCSIVRQGE
jgi:hypothetical protein